MTTTRREFLAAAGLSAAARPAAAAARPNLLVIMTDQQFSEAMSCVLGKKYIHTPHMDSLAAAGTLFTRAYCANPLCVPSRASMFSGRYPAETRVQTNEDLAALDTARFPNMGTIFRKAGYQTSYFGKWHMPYPVKDAAAHGFETAPNIKGDETIADATAAWLRGRKGQTAKPLLTICSLLNPHNICQWARSEKLPDGAIGDPPPLAECPPWRPNHEPPRDEPDIMTLMRRSYQANRMFPVGGFDERKWREYIWAYYRMIEKVDGEIGKVLGALREAGQEERTLIVFLADHGDCQGSHRWNQKTVFYDEASRVPFIVSRKGSIRAGKSDRLVHTGVDLIPTLCGAAGIPVPQGLPGLNLMDTANGKQVSDPRQYVVVNNCLAQGAPVDGRTPRPDGRMVRSRRFKYCVYSEGKLRESLVDMEKDPGEMVNLAVDARYKAELERHRAMLREWAGRTGDTFQIPKA
jgi:arylsulfatase A-like enzyme